MVIVTMDNGGGKKRRYVVDAEDEYLFDGVPDGKITREDWFDGPHFHFGGQWLRGPGRIDEMYRSLDASEAVSVKRAARA